MKIKVRTGNKQSCLKSFPPIIVFRKLSGRKFRVFRRSPEVRGLTNMRWFQDAGDTGCTAWIPWEGTASNHWDLRWHWYFLCWHTLKQSTCSADIPTWSKLFYNINLGNAHIITSWYLKQLIWMTVTLLSICCTRTVINNSYCLATLIFFYYYSLFYSFLIPSVVQLRMSTVYKRIWWWRNKKYVYLLLKMVINHWKKLNWERCQRCTYHWCTKRTCWLLVNFTSSSSAASVSSCRCRITAGDYPDYRSPFICKRSVNQLQISIMLQIIQVGSDCRMMLHPVTWPEVTT